MPWVVATAVWLAATVFTAWRYLRAPSKARLIAYVMVGVVGLVPYLWLLLHDQLPRGYASLITTFWVVMAVASTVVVGRRKAGR